MFEEIRNQYFFILTHDTFSPRSTYNANSQVRSRIKKNDALTIWHGSIQRPKLFKYIELINHHSIKEKKELKNAVYHCNTIGEKNQQSHHTNNQSFRCSCSNFIKRTMNHQHPPPTTRPTFMFSLLDFYRRRRRHAQILQATPSIKRTGTDIRYAERAERRRIFLPARWRSDDRKLCGRRRHRCHGEKGRFGGGREGEVYKALEINR